jgi:tetratricopeptide (TPR) repeat protein
LRVRMAALGQEHPDYAASLINLGVAYCSQAKFDYAEQMFRQAMKLEETVLGAEHPQLVTVISYIAKLYTAQGRHLEATPFYRRAFQIQERAFGIESMEIIRTLEAYAISLRQLKWNREARKLEARALALRGSAAA